MARGMACPELQAVILCGGAGTRLRGVLDGVPKALAPVAGQPFLDHVLLKLRDAGLRQALLCIGVHADAIRARYRACPVPGMALSFSEEREPLGTGGALRNAAPAILGETFLLLNGDTFVDLDVDRFLAQHRRDAAAITLALAHVANGERYGAVELDERGQVRSFHEKAIRPSGNAEPAAAFINAGWYLLQREVLQSVPKAPPAVSLEFDVLPRWIGRGLYGYVTDGYFIDIGVPEDLLRAQTELAGRANCDAAHTR